MLEEDARGQRRLAEYQKSDADPQRKTVEYAEMLQGWADQTRQQLKRFEQREGE